MATVALSEDVHCLLLDFPFKALTKIPPSPYFLLISIQGIIVLKDLIVTKGETFKVLLLTSFKND